MTTTPTSGAAIQRYKIGYHADEWVQRSSTPSVIPDASGSWVRYADHVTALAAGQATAAQAGAPANMRLCYSCGHPADAHPWVNDPRGGKRRGDCPAAPAQPVAQQGVAYAEMTEKYYLAGGEVPTWDVDQMRAFADATHALRVESLAAAYCEELDKLSQRNYELRLASHGQAPTDAKALAEADRRAGEAERLLATCKEDVMRFEQVRSRMKYQWGAEQRVSFDEVWDEALALKKAAQAAPQAADSVPAPPPPPECETEAEKRAFAFGWFKALESERMKADNKKKGPL